MKPSNSFEQDNGPALAEIERLIEEERYSEVIARLGIYCNCDAPNLELTLYHLFALLKVDSFAAHEQQIEQFITAENLSNKEREILRRVIILGFDEAKKENQHDRAMVYQRLARRLVLGQPLAEVWLSRQPHYPTTEVQPESVAGLEKPIRQKSSEYFLAGWNKREVASLLSVLVIVICIVLVGIETYDHVDVNRSTPVVIAQIPNPPDRALENLTPVPKLAPPTAPAEEDEVSRSIPHHEPKVLAKRKKEIGAGKQPDIKPVREQVTEGPLGQEPRVKEVQRRVKIRVALPLRQQPRFGANALETIERGSIVGVLDSHGDWLEVRTQADSRVGYIRKEFAVQLAGDRQR
jgi:hypothetical protein